MRRRAFLVGVVTSLLILEPRGHTEQSPAPMTPARLAMMTLTPGPELDAALVTALATDQPGVRLVASRAAGVMGRHDASVERALGEALDRETSPAVAAEIVRALLLLDTPASTGLAESYLDRAAPRVVQILAAASANHSSADLLQRLPAYSARLGDEALTYLQPVILNAASRDPRARLDLLHAAAAIATDRSWRSLLQNLSTAPDAPSDLAILEESLRSTRPAIRETTVWHLVGQLAGAQPVAPSLLAAARPDRSNTDVTWERFGRELVDRAVGQAARVDRADLIAAHADAVPRIRVDGSLLTKPERAAFERVLGKRAEQSLAAKPTTAVEPVVEFPRSPMPVTRLVTSLWPAFLGDLLSTTHCKATSDGLGAVGITYGATGRPAKVEIDSTKLVAGCVVALNVLGNLTVRDDLRRALLDNRERLLLIPDSDIIACADEIDPAGDDQSTLLRIDPADIREPRKIKDVKPIYPKSAIDARAEGSVQLKSVIARSGCVRDVTIVRSVHPALDLAALRAVLRWKFAPALLNGKTVEVLMTLTVSYMLQ